jgi:hypothetical protein
MPADEWNTALSAPQAFHFKSGAAPLVGTTFQVLLQTSRKDSLLVANRLAKRGKKSERSPHEADEEYLEAGGGGWIDIATLRGRIRSGTGSRI